MTAIARSFLWGLTSRFINRILDDLVLDDGTEAYTFPGKDEQGQPASFTLRPVAFRACVEAIRQRFRAELAR